VGDPKWTDAKHGKGLDFEGDATVYVEVPHADDLSLEEWTIEGWFLVRNVGGGWDCPFAKETADPNRNYALHIQGGGGILHGSISIGNAFGHATFGATNIADSEWHYFATTYDGDICLLYIDGEEDFGRSTVGPAGEIGGPADLNEGPVTIGANPAPAYAFDGIIDEVRLSSVARTQEEIQEAMEKGLKAMAAVSPGGKLAVAWASIKEQ
jgi:hypothetical protein